MKPPPSTPTPRRFLTKRSASSQLPHSTPTPMRFQSTPRFGSTQSATTRQMEDVEEIDVAASQSQSQSSATEQPRSDARDVVSDSIEVDSYADSQASPAELRSSSSSGSSEHELEDGDETRPTGYASGGDEDDWEDAGMGAPAEDLYEGTGTPPPVKRRRLLASSSPATQDLVAACGSDTGHYETRSESEQEYEEQDIQDKARTRAPAQQPTFQPAPRFKAPEEEHMLGHDYDGDTTASALLAAPLSPQRRGAQYVAGGLAAQLQGLLSQVKGSETLGGSGGGDGAVVRLAVDEVGPGSRMHLVQGRVLSRGAVTEPEGIVRRYILAGGGGATRLVKQGSVVRIMAAPAWEVRLGEEWTVACEWCIES